MGEPVESCVKPAKGPISSTEPATDQPDAGPKTVQESNKMIAKVGKLAPDFEASAYLGGTFKNVRLSEFKGNWVVLCFYPGDFTFV